MFIQKFLDVEFLEFCKVFGVFLVSCTNCLEFGVKDEDRS